MATGSALRTWNTPRTWNRPLTRSSGHRPLLAVQARSQGARRRDHPYRPAHGHAVATSSGRHTVQRHPEPRRGAAIAEASHLVARAAARDVATAGRGGRDKGRTGQRSAYGGVARTAVHGPRPRLRQPPGNTPCSAIALAIRLRSSRRRSRQRGRSRCLAGRSPCVRRQRRRDVRRWSGTGWRRGARRLDPTLEQWPGRGADQPPQAAETAKLRPGQLRPTATARSDGGMIHAKPCGRPWRGNALLHQLKPFSRPFAFALRPSGNSGRHWEGSGQLRPPIRLVARRVPLAIMGVRLRVRHQSAGRAQGTTLRSVWPELPRLQPLPSR